MANDKVKQMLDAGVHFGHLTRKWNPAMAPYIFMERNGIHIIDLYKTHAKLDIAGEAMAKIAASGRKIMYVATKKQAKEIVAKNAETANMPYITERWPGGMLTNFVTIRKAVKKMQGIDKMKEDGTFMTLSKKERLQVDRQRAKLEKQLGSISDMTRLPGALFIVDINKEHIAVAEAQKLGIPTVAVVDTNSDPNEVDYAIPANDDATRSIDFIVGEVTEYIKKGLTERKAEKARSSDEKIKKAAAKKANVDEAPAPAPVAEKPAKEEAPKAEAAPVAEKPAKKAAPKKAAVKAEKATETPEVKEEVKTEE